MDLEILNGKKTYIAATSLALLGLSKLADTLVNTTPDSWNALFTAVVASEGWTLLAQALAALGIRHAISKNGESNANQS